MCVSPSKLCVTVIVSVSGSLCMCLSPYVYVSECVCPCQFARLCVSLCVSLCVCLSQSVCLSQCLCVLFFACVCVCLSLSVCVCLSVCASLSVCVSQCVCPSQFACLCVSLCVSLSVFFSLSVCVSQCVCFSVCFLCRGSCHLQTLRVLLLLFQSGFLLFLFLLWLLWLKLPKLCWIVVVRVGTLVLFLTLGEMLSIFTIEDNVCNTCIDFYNHHHNKNIELFLNQIYSSLYPFIVIVIFLSLSLGNQLSFLHLYNFIIEKGI